MKPSISRLSALLFSGLFLVGCSSNPKWMPDSADNEPAGPRVRWYAHCDECKWCKGGYKTTQEAQAIVSEHNKRLHDWIKVAYYDQINCR